MTDLIRTSHARSTGTLVEVWRPGVISDAGWVTLCEHGSIIEHETRALAISWAAAPEIWCEIGCREGDNPDA